MASISANLYTKLFICLEPYVDGTDLETYFTKTGADYKEITGIQSMDAFEEPASYDKQPLWGSTTTRPTYTQGDPTEWMVTLNYTSDRWDVQLQDLWRSRLPHAMVLVVASTDFTFDPNNPSWSGKAYYFLGQPNRLATSVQTSDVTTLQVTFWNMGDQTAPTKYTTPGAVVSSIVYATRLKKYQVWQYPAMAVTNQKNWVVGERTGEQITSLRRIGVASRVGEQVTSIRKFAILSPIP